MNPNVLLIVLPYLQLSRESKAGYWGPKYEKRVSPSTKMNSWPALPYGCLSIATYCKDVANIMIIDCNVDEEYMISIRNAMDDFRPEIVGFTMTFDNSYSHLPKIARMIKGMSPDTIMVIGGAATPPVCEEILFDNPEIDAVCYCDGEIPFRDLCMARYKWTLLTQHISWVTRWTDECSKPKPEKTVIQNLDEILELDYKFICPSNYAMREEFSPFAEEIKDQKRFFIVTSKGCPYRCAFCYRSRENDRKMRFASVDKVIGHVEYLVKRYGMNVLTICDDQFLAHTKRAKEIFERLIHFNLRVECLQGVSVAFIDEEMAELMYAAGVRRVVLPIESGCKEVLDKMVEKPVDLDKAKETIKILRAHGLWVTAVFVMGFPGETAEHRKKTLQWVREAELDWCTFSAAVPIRGTKLWDICVEGGYLQKDKVKLGEMDFSNYFIETPWASAEEVTKDIYRMNLQVNFVENYAMKQKNFGTAVKAFKQVIKMYENHAFAWWYLYLCYFEMGEPVKAYYAHRKFFDIIDTDPKWKAYAREFKLGGIYG